MAMSSKSSTAYRKLNVASKAPLVLNANNRERGPSLWVQSMPGLRALAARPEASRSAVVVTMPQLVPGAKDVHVVQAAWAETTAKTRKTQLKRLTAPY